MKRSFELSMLMVLDELMIAACLSGEAVRVLHPVVVPAVQNIATSLNSMLVADWSSYCCEKQQSNDEAVHC